MKYRDALEHIQPKGTILEVGCGIGAFAKLIKQKGWKDRYWGIDKNLNSIRVASKLHPDMVFLCFDMSKKNDSTDSLFGDAKTFCAFQVLEHIGKRGNFEDVDMLKRLNNGTKIIISVPDFKSQDHKRWFNLNEWVERYSPVFDIEDTKTYPISKAKNHFLLWGVK